MSDNVSARLTRRAFLGGVAGTCAFLGATPLRAQPPGRITGLAFSGETVIAVGPRTLLSTDRGATWAAATAPGRAPVAITSHPAVPGRLFVSAEGGGVEISLDGGASWRQAGAGLPDLTINALATSASQPDTLYAAIGGDGLWRSEDAGEAWEFVMDRPFIADAEQDVLALASVDVASGMGGIWLYAGSTAGLQRVPDCFCRWQGVEPLDPLDALVDGRTGSDVAPLPEGQPVTALVSCAAVPDRLFAALPSGIWASADAGVAWRMVAERVATALAVDPANPETLVAATNDGLIHSRDGGASWTNSTLL